MYYRNLLMLGHPMMMNDNNHRQDFRLILIFKWNFKNRISQKNINDNKPRQLLLKRKKVNN